MREQLSDILDSLFKSKKHRSKQHSDPEKIAAPDDPILPWSTLPTKNSTPLLASASSTSNASSGSGNASIFLHEAKHLAVGLTTAQYPDQGAAGSSGSESERVLRAFVSGYVSS